MRFLHSLIILIVISLHYGAKAETTVAKANDEKEASPEKTSFTPSDCTNNKNVVSVGRTEREPMDVVKYIHACSGVYIHTKTVLTVKLCKDKFGPDRPIDTVTAKRAETGSLIKITELSLMAEGELMLVKVESDIPERTVGPVPIKGELVLTFCHGLELLGYGIDGHDVQCVKAKLKLGGCKNDFDSLIKNGSVAYSETGMFCTASDKQYSVEPGYAVTCSNDLPVGFVIKTTEIGGQTVALGYKVTNKFLHFLYDFTGLRGERASCGVKEIYSKYLIAMIFLTCIQFF